MNQAFPDDPIPPPYQGIVPRPPDGDGNEVFPPNPYMGTVADPTSLPVMAEPKAVPALNPPPREVPMLVRASNLLGGFYNQFGWIWLGITGAIAWFFVPNADVAGLYHFTQPLATASGVVTASRETNFSENDVRVYAQTYRFEGPDGREREGQSYATGHRLDTGRKVTVEYVAGKPAISRIQGMRRSPFGIEGWTGLIVFGVLGVFVVVGLAFWVTGVRRGLRANRLLAGGMLALGRMTGRRRTRTRINKRIVYEFTFSFSADDRQTYEAKARTHETERLTDPQGEFLLYDPLDPPSAVLLDNIPGRVRIDDVGALETEKPHRAIASLLLPAVVLAANMVIALFVLG